MLDGCKKVKNLLLLSFLVVKVIKTLWLRLGQSQGVRYLTGDQIKVVQAEFSALSLTVTPGITKEGSITILLTSCLTGLDQSVMQINAKIVSSHTADSNPVKQEVNSTVILPSLVFPGYSHSVTILSFCVIKLCYLGNHCGMAVNYHGKSFITFVHCGKHNYRGNLVCYRGNLPRYFNNRKCRYYIKLLQYFYNIGPRC